MYNTLVHVHNISNTCTCIYIWNSTIIIYRITILRKLLITILTEHCDQCVQYYLSFRNVSCSDVNKYIMCIKTNTSVVTYQIKNICLCHVTNENMCCMSCDF